MLETKPCEKCGGHNYLMLRGVGRVEGWQTPTGREDQWFCPRCNWGTELDPPADEL